MPAPAPARRPKTRYRSHIILSDDDDSSESEEDDGSTHQQSKRTKTTPATSFIVPSCTNPFKDYSNIRVFPFGLLCLVCNVPISHLSDSKFGQHLKLHPVEYEDMKKQHGCIKSGHRHIQSLQKDLCSVPFVPQGEEVTRFKCLFCSKSYALIQGFNKHVSQSAGKCEGSVPVPTIFVKTIVGTFIEKTKGPLSYNAMMQQQQKKRLLNSLTPARNPIQLEQQQVTPFTKNGLCTVTPSSISGHLVQQPQFDIIQQQEFRPTASPNVNLLSSQSTGQQPILRAQVAFSSPLGLSRQCFPGIGSLEISMDTRTTERVLLEYIPENEQVVSYLPFFYSLIGLRCQGESSHFKMTMNNWVLYGSNPPVGEPMIEVALESAEQWLTRRARHETGIMSAHVRATILNFSGTDVSETTQNTTFHFRRQEKLLRPLALRLVAFALRYESSIKCCFFETFGHSGTSLPESAVPWLLTTLLLETTNHSFINTVLSDFCLSLCFQVIGRSQTLKMRTCGPIASDVSAVLFICRAGVLSFLISRYGVRHHEYCMDYALRAKESVSTSNLSSLIRTCREMNKRKPSSRYCTVDPSNGDIFVDTIHIPMDKWSKYIPLMEALCRDCVSVLMVGTEWQRFVNVSILLTLQKWKGDDIKFLSGDKSSTTMQCNPCTAANLLLFDKLSAAMELTFHTLGGGGMRHTEIDKTARSMACWHAGSFYYSSNSEKLFTFRSIVGDPILRKMPPTLARYYMLYLFIANKYGIKGEGIVIRRDGASISSKELFRNIFGLTVIPDETQIRQFVAQVVNVEFGGTNLSVLAANDEESTSLFGHAATTHANNYMTFVKGVLKQCSADSTRR